MDGRKDYGTSDHPMTKAEFDVSTATDQSEPMQPAWISQCDARELAQIRHARAYAESHASAGAPGHGQFLLIAKLARLLDESEARHV